MINMGVVNARSLSNAQSHSTEWCIRFLDWEQTSSCSPDILYQLPPSTTIDSFLFVQLTCLTVLFHTSVQVLFGFLLPWNPLLHTLCISSPSHHLFCNTFPYRRSLFCCNTSVMSSICNLFFSCLLGNLSFTLMLHIHLTILISARWSATTFSFLTGQVSLSCNMLLHTQLRIHLHSQTTFLSNSVIRPYY